MRPNKLGSPHLRHACICGRPTREFFALLCFVFCLFFFCEFFAIKLEVFAAQMMKRGANLDRTKWAAPVCPNFESHFIFWSSVLLGFLFDDPCPNSEVVFRFSRFSGGPSYFPHPRVYHCVVSTTRARTRAGGGRASSIGLGWYQIDRAVRVGAVEAERGRGRGGGGGRVWGERRRRCRCVLG